MNQMITYILPILSVIFNAVLIVLIIRDRRRQRRFKQKWERMDNEIQGAIRRMEKEIEKGRIRQN